MYYIVIELNFKYIKFKMNYIVNVLHCITLHLTSNDDDEPCY